MSILPTDPQFRLVATVLAVLAGVAIFAVADPILKVGLLLGVVFGGYLLFNRGKK